MPFQVTPCGSGKAKLGSGKYRLGAGAEEPSASAQPAAPAQPAALAQLQPSALAQQPKSSAEGACYVIGWCEGHSGWVIGAPTSRICGRTDCKVDGNHRLLTKGKAGKKALAAAGGVLPPTKSSGEPFEFMWDCFKFDSSGKPVPR